MRAHIAAPVGVVVVAAGVMAGALWRVRPRDPAPPSKPAPRVEAATAHPVLPQRQPMSMTGDEQTIEDPSIVTEHGLAVGMPLADVLTLKTRHRCELISGILSSAGPVHRVLRCWVGAEPAHYRYVSYLPDRPFANPEAQFGVQEELRGDDPPASGAALDTWIASSAQKIELILWRQAPVSED
jgi:hypothetical protein